ncbi:fructosamine kinase family protein [Marinobacter caseinilyticus]|uniref:fructosamine kinase family protein n=1 Tax=Marinobacter caseinilyticus TaxID=2692195 RepID=UPI00140DC378|nr:fructosamine kinase family protein [Marinobacter caseinilyticus]
MNIPQVLQDLLSAQGLPACQSVTGVSGGCINEAYRARLVDGRELFAKTHDAPPLGLFAAEANGLQALADTQTVRVPSVLGVGEHGLLLEWLAGSPAPDYWPRFGQQLAQLHQHRAGRFGFDSDNYCGLTPQPNPRLADGYAFFATARLQHQGDLARAKGLLGLSDSKRLDRVSERLPEWLPPQPASLIHGDLWGGNAHCGPRGEPVLIDPAVHYGWPEAELAMTTLFGRFPETFYSAYLAGSEVEPDWATRARLYNLYHLLNHLNLFGRGYLGSVRAVLRHYGSSH